MNITFKTLCGCVLSLLALRAPLLAQTPITQQGFYDMYQAKNDNTWSGSDQGTSLRASNGVNYWIHADTILGTEAADGAYNPGWTMIGNSILRETNGTLQIATSGSLAVPNPPDGVPGTQDRYWLQGMFEANGFAYGLAQRVKNDGAGGFSFPGNSFAKFRFESSGQLTFLNMVDSPMTGVPGSSYRASVVSGGFVYVYGTGGAGSPGGTWVHRCALSQVETPGAWQFWKGGTTWSAGSSGRAKVRDDQVESVHILNGKWVLLFKPYGGATAYSNVGNSPTGPFTQNFAFDAPFFTGANGYQVQTYCAQLHPEYHLASGKFLASIAWNSDLFNAVAKDADLYKLRFFEIDIPGVVYPRYECETLSVAQLSSGTALDSVSASGYSAGQANILRATGSGPRVTFVVPHIPAGTYNVKIGVKKFPTRGRFQLSISRPNEAATNVGAEQDQWAQFETYTEIDCGTWSPSTTSDKWFTFTATGKNSSSSGYDLTFDYIKLTPQ